MGAHYAPEVFPGNTRTGFSYQQAQASRKPSRSSRRARKPGNSDLGRKRYSGDPAAAVIDYGPTDYRSNRDGTLSPNANGTGSNKSRTTLRQSHESLVASKLPASNDEYGTTKRGSQIRDGEAGACSPQADPLQPARGQSKSIRHSERREPLVAGGKRVKKTKQNIPSSSRSPRNGLVVALQAREQLTTVMSSTGQQRHPQNMKTSGL